MNWKIAFAHHDKCMMYEYRKIADIEASDMTILSASVPGNFEQDLMDAGLLEDLFFSTNTLKAQELEDVHLWYYTKVQVADKNQYLRFEGIDTFSDIYVNGELVKSTDNMFIAYDVEADWNIGENEVIVHIKPAMLEARKFSPPVVSCAMQYNAASLYVRKAAHTYGWDIMPRIISAGIWKEVTLCERKNDSVDEVYFSTSKIEKDEEGKDTALVRVAVKATLGATLAQDYKVIIRGCCGDSVFEKEERMWHNYQVLSLRIPSCKLWWPKNSGEQNLYDVEIKLCYKDQVCDTYHLKAGIRTVELEKTPTTDQDGNGEFCFRVNNKKIFVLGTNWVPMDAFHSNDKNRLPKALELLDEIGCNMVRCWGGNVYEDDMFFDFCDEHGILIWQDFAMGCAVYPDTDLFAEKLEEEAIFQIKRLRNHPSLALWAGDNECDLSFGWFQTKIDPNQVRLTRELLPRLVMQNDYARPYLPSSPFISPEVFRGEGLAPEEHLWGPRDYFKGPYYKDTFTHFASETGYHGFPALKSLEKFLREPKKIFVSEAVPTDEYLVHASCPETVVPSAYSYRIQLAYDQVKTLFGKAEENFEDFLRQSQISQAEAKKYFIEKFRIGKWKRTGIIWWNLVDGWPQVSDAIVDYYYTKKLAFSYIKRSQEPVCLMFDEPQDGKICLVVANDLPVEKTFTYEVKKGEKVILKGDACVPADSAVRLDSVEIEENEKEFYYIEWKMDGQVYKNHYFTNIIDIDYNSYMKSLKEYGMDEFEGFYR